MSADCCAPEPRRKDARWAGVGAVVAALLSSACCWLPLALMALGVSAGGLGGWFGAYRWVFLAASLGLLGLGFFWMKRQRRWWIAGAVVAVVAATAPSYAATLLGERTAPAAVAVAEGEARAYIVEGMSCAACAGPIIDALAKLPGVASVEVSYAAKRASVHFRAGALPDDAAVLAALDDLGYEGRRE